MQGEVEESVTIDKKCLAKYLNENIATDIFEAVNSLSQFEIPGHIIVVLLLICIFSRDGQLMEKQVIEQFSSSEFKDFLISAQS